MYMYMYLYGCVWFELKFSTGQVVPKMDSPVQNRTPGNPTQPLHIIRIVIEYASIHNKRV